MLLVMGKLAIGDTHEVVEVFFDDLMANRKAERAEREAA
jgi:hypothetical protein